MNKTQGRKICDVLKEIRKKVANEGNLELNQKECKYKGECSGTCPACEAELRKINQTFNHKKLLAMAGCATMVLPMTACTNGVKTDDIQGDFEYTEEILVAEDETEKLPEDIISGKIVPKKKENKELEELEPLQGDIAYEDSIIQEDNDENEPFEESEFISSEPITQGVLPPEEYVFTENEENFPKGVTTLEDLEIAEKMKQLIKKDFPTNHLRGVISPNAKFH